MSTDGPTSTQRLRLWPAPLDSLVTGSLQVSSGLIPLYSLYRWWKNKISEHGGVVPLLSPQEVQGFDPTPQELPEALFRRPSLAFTGGHVTWRLRAILINSILGRDLLPVLRRPDRQFPIVFRSVHSRDPFVRFLRLVGDGADVTLVRMPPPHDRLVPLSVPNDRAKVLWEIVPQFLQMACFAQPSNDNPVIDPWKNYENVIEINAPFQIPEGMTVFDLPIPPADYAGQRELFSKFVANLISTCVFVHNSASMEESDAMDMSFVQSKFSENKVSSPELFSTCSVLDFETKIGKFFDMFSMNVANDMQDYSQHMYRLIKDVSLPVSHPLDNVITMGRLSQYEQEKWLMQLIQSNLRCMDRIAHELARRIDLLTKIDLSLPISELSLSFTPVSSRPINPSTPIYQVCRSYLASFEPHLWKHIVLPHLITSTPLSSFISGVPPSQLPPHLHQLLSDCFLHIVRHHFLFTISRCVDSPVIEMPALPWTPAHSTRLISAAIQASRSIIQLLKSAEIRRSAILALQSRISDIFNQIQQYETDSKTLMATEESIRHLEMQGLMLVTQTSAIGQHFDNEKQIGSGSYGLVLRADWVRDGNNNMPIVLKIPHSRSRFINTTLALADELHFTSKLSDLNMSCFPKLLGTYSRLLENDKHVIAMILEPFDMNLADYWRQLDPKCRTFRFALEIVLQMSICVEQLHRLGIMHRDIKLDNFFVSLSLGNLSPRVVLADFGLATERAFSREFVGGPAHFGAADDDFFSEVGYTCSVDIKALAFCMQLLMNPWWSASSPAFKTIREIHALCDARWCWQRHTASTLVSSLKEVLRSLGDPLIPSPEAVPTEQRALIEEKRGNEVNKRSSHTSLVEKPGENDLHRFAVMPSPVESTVRNTIPSVVTIHSASSGTTGSSSQTGIDSKPISASINSLISSEPQPSSSNQHSSQVQLNQDLNTPSFPSDPFYDTLSGGVSMPSVSTFQSSDYYGSNGSYDGFPSMPSDGSNAEFGHTYVSSNTFPSNIFIPSDPIVFNSGPEDPSFSMPSIPVYFNQPSLENEPNNGNKWQNRKLNYKTLNKFVQQIKKPTMFVNCARIFMIRMFSPLVTGGPFIQCQTSTTKGDGKVEEEENQVC